MTKKHPLETKLPEEYERHRARFLGMTVEDIKFVQWHHPLKRWQHRGEPPGESDQRSDNPPVKRLSGTTMFPYDLSEIGQRRLKAAGDHVAEVGRQAGLAAWKRLNLKRQQAESPAELGDESPPETPAA